jgi:uncharacterized protein with PQ loop repeat
MTAIHPGSEAQVEGNARTGGGLRRVLRFFSMVTMAMTVPQVVAVWTTSQVMGVSLASWLTYLCSAILWFFYGLRKRDKTIYFACIGWILLDAAIVLGVWVHS